MNIEDAIEQYNDLYMIEGNYIYVFIDGKKTMNEIFTDIHNSFFAAAYRYVKDKKMMTFNRKFVTFKLFSIQSVLLPTGNRQECAVYKMGYDLNKLYALEEIKNEKRK